MCQRRNVFPARQRKRVKRDLRFYRNSSRPGGNADRGIDSYDKLILSSRKWSVKSKAINSKLLMVEWQALIEILSIWYEKTFFPIMVRCGGLMARWKAENERSSMVLSKIKNVWE